MDRAGLVVAVLLAVAAPGWVAAAPPEAPAVAEAATAEHVDAQGAAKLVETTKPTVIDVRTPKEFAEGHLKGAKNIDFLGDRFEESLAKLDRDKPYLVHCRSGRRSTASLKVFEKLGFKKIYHLDGGVNAWTKAGLPLTQASKEDE